MGKLVLYGGLESPPVRSAALALSELGVDFELKVLDYRNEKYMSEEYLKMNRQHTVPVLDDNGEYICDSHAIAAYVVRKYGKNDALYPKDFYLRAVVDQRLHFDSEVLFARAIKGFWNPQNSKEQNIGNVLEAYNFLEAFFQATYIAGDHLTIADLCVLTSVSTLNCILPIDVEKTPKLAAWLDLMKKLPYYEEVNGKGLAGFAERLNELAATIRD